jgi:hypothetical protein
LLGSFGAKVAASCAVSIRMPDQQDFAAALEMDRRLAVHLGDQRTGGVQ